MIVGQRGSDETGEEGLMERMMDIDGKEKEPNLLVKCVK